MESQAINPRPTQTMPKLMKPRSLTGALILLLVLGLTQPGLAQQDTGPEAAPAAPGAVVAQVNEALIGAMREAEALAFQGRYARLAPVFMAAFHFPFMARVAAGWHWRDLQPEQKPAHGKAGNSGVEGGT